MPECDTAQAAAAQDEVETFLSAFPVPGELWTHLFAMTNYYSAILHHHPPPTCGEPPRPGGPRFLRVLPDAI